MDTSVAAVTVNVVWPEISPNVAVIVVVPMVDEVASPSEPAALLMIAIAVFEEAQVTDDVRFCVGPSVNIPVAINCCVVPLAILGLTGVTSMETSAAAVTVNVVLPEMSPDVAVIVVVPTVNPEASPFKPTALLMFATAVFEEVQVTDDVISIFVLSE